MMEYLNINFWLVNPTSSLRSHWYKLATLLLLGIALSSSSVAANELEWHSGRLNAKNCVKIYRGVLDSHDGSEQLIMENSCNYKIDVSWCNAGATEKQNGCGTGEKYYRQNRSFKPRERYANKYSLILGMSQEYAACPMYEGGYFGSYGGIKSYTSGGNYSCYPPEAEVEKKKIVSNGDADRKDDSPKSRKEDFWSGGEESGETHNPQDFWSGGTENDQPSPKQDFWAGKGSDTEEQLLTENTKAEASNQFIGNVRSRSARVRIFCIDTGSEDGDLVRITNNGATVENKIYLTNAGESYWFELEFGQNEIEIIALNQGDAGANTAAFKLYDDEGNLLAKKGWHLKTGYKGKLLILKL